MVNPIPARRAKLGVLTFDVLLEVFFGKAAVTIGQGNVAFRLLLHHLQAQFAVIARQWRVSLFVGITSALGSIGWFTAVTVERAAYVKSLGQVEFLFALVISTLFFRERTTGLELAGMMLVAVGVVVLLLAA